MEHQVTGGAQDATDAVLDVGTVGDISPFLDLPVPPDDASLDKEDLTRHYAGKLAQAMSIDADTALAVCQDVLSVGPQARVRDLVKALVPLGPHPGWPRFGEGPPHRLLRFLCDTGSESRKAMLNGIPSMPLFALPKSASSYSSAVLADVMGVRTGIVSMWHLAAYRPWVQYASRSPMPNHDHMPPHSANLEELVAAGIRRVVVQVRDPRQLIVSQIRHSQEFGGNTDISDESIATVSRNYAHWIAGWRVVAPAYGIEVQLVRFEDIVSNDRRFFDAILDFFEAPSFLHDNLARALQRAEMQRSSGGLNYRKGLADEWKEILTPSQAATITAGCGIAFDGLYSFPASASRLTGMLIEPLSCDEVGDDGGQSPEGDRRATAPTVVPEVAAAEFYRSLADQLAAKGRWREAIAVLQRPLAQGGRDAASEKRLGELLREVGDLETAALAYRRAVALDPAAADVKEALAGVLELMGSRAEAIEILREVAAGGGDAAVHARLGQLLIADRDLADAAAAFGRAVELDAAAVDYRLALAGILEQLGRHVETAAVLASLAALDTGDASVCARQGHLQVRLGDLAAAALAYRRAIALDPAAADVKEALAGVLELMGSRAEAIEILREAAAGGGDAAVHARLGQLLITNGDLAGAEAAFRDAVALDPASVRHRRTLADVLDADGRSSEGVQLLEELLAHRPREAQLHARLGQMLIRGGDLRRAEASLQAAIAIDPRLVNARRNLADVLSATGRPNQARAILESLTAQKVDEPADLLRLEIEPDDHPEPQAGPTVFPATSPRAGRSEQPAVSADGPVAGYAAVSPASGAAVEAASSVVAKQDEPAEDQLLTRWIADYCRSDEYRAKVAALLPRKLMTPPEEVALICGLIEHLDTRLAIEIGTSQAKTARIIAETMATCGGKLLTVDPFGAERGPRIIAEWPAELQAVTEFRPVNSMELFATIEAEALRHVSRTPIGVVFVDGNHKFEYALFDIMEAADNVTAGGAVVIDNMEQTGPLLAALHFLKLNPAWKLYHRGEIWSAGTSKRDLSLPAKTATSWGVLVAPRGIQVATTGRKFSGRLQRPELVSGIALAVREVSAAIELTVNFLFVAWPHDFHQTGEGARSVRKEVSVRLMPGGGVVHVDFDPPAQLAVERQDVHLRYELELMVDDEDGYALLDGDAPFRLLLGEPSADTA